MLPSDQALLSEILRITENETIPDFNNPDINKKVEKGFADLKRDWLYKTWPHVIGGYEYAHLSKKHMFISDDPYWGSESPPLGHFFGTPDQAFIDQAMARVKASQKRWEKLGWKKRLSVLYRLAQMLQEDRWVYLFVASLVSEIGMSYAEAYGEYNEVYRFLLQTVYMAMRRYEHGDGLPTIPSAQSSGSTHGYHIRPYGIAVLAFPFNFPTATSTNMIGPALAMGNAVIMKGSDKAALTTRILYEAFSGALAAEGIENNGIVNFAPGSGGDMVNALLAHKDVKLFSFTGSSEVFESVMKAHQYGKRRNATQLMVGCAETGGVNIMLLCEDADPNMVALAIKSGNPSRSSQKCSSTRIVLLPENMVADVMEETIALFETMTYGNVREGAFMGPLISRDAKERITEKMNALVKNGIVAVAYEKAIFPLPSGYDFAPTILVAHPGMYDPWDDEMFDELMNTELFAPVVTFVPYRSLEEAERIVSHSRYGLTGTVFTDDPDNLAWGLDLLPSGMKYMNRKQTGATAAEGFHGAGGTASSYNGGAIGQDLIGRHCTTSVLSGHLWLKRRWTKEEFERFVTKYGDNFFWIKHPVFSD